MGILSASWLVSASAQAPIPPSLPVDAYVRESDMPSVTLQDAPGRTIVCSCVLWAKWYLGRQDEVWGTAKYIKPTSEVPYVGGVVLLNEGYLGHVAVITKIAGSSFEVIEANYIPCQVSTRQIAIDSPDIRGYK